MIEIRRFEAADLDAVVRIYDTSIHGVAGSHYSREQCDAWAPKDLDASKWLPRLLEYHTFVAAENAAVIAWIAMTATGYIDMLFCAPQAARRGIAAQLYSTVESIAIAIAADLPHLSAHASLLAQPFFTKRSWSIDRHESHHINGVALPRAAMSKHLPRSFHAQH